MPTSTVPTPPAPTSAKSINLVTEVPGPLSRALVERRVAATSRGAAFLSELAVASSSGAVVHDLDGNTLLDFVGGIGVLALGHGPEAVVERIRSQAEELIHMCAIAGTYEPYVALAERLNELAPGSFEKKTILLNSGAEAVEAAVKIARVATNRQGILVFEGAYHGRTNLTMGMTSKYSLFKKGFGPFASEIYRIPFPNTFRRPPGMEEKPFIDWSIAKLHEALVSQVDPSALAAIVIEPVQGEGGFLPAPPAYLQAIRSICDEHGIVMISDEIQAGMGRTGKLWSIEHSGVVPDLITTAKSLGSGMPIAAVTGRADMVDAPHPGGMGGTYSGNPLACVAASASLDAIADPAFLERANDIGTLMRSRLTQIQAKHPERVVDVRGLGPMLAIELAHDSASLEPDGDLTLAITKAALARGLLLIRAGLFSNCVRFLPPLIVSDDQVNEAMDVLEEAIEAAIEGRP